MRASRTVPSRLVVLFRSRIGRACSSSRKTHGGPFISAASLAGSPRIWCRRKSGSLADRGQRVEFTLLCLRELVSQYATVSFSLLPLAGNRLLCRERAGARCGPWRNPPFAAMRRVLARSSADFAAPTELMCAAVLGRIPLSAIAGESPGQYLFSIRLESESSSCTTDPHLCVTSPAAPASRIVFRRQVSVQPRFP